MGNCIIIENDKVVVEKIKSLELDFAKTTFIESNENMDNALDLILKHTPLIVFLNIDTNQINISEFLFNIHQYATTYPTLIALSSFKEKAYEAYKYNFSDFLLKPLKEISIRKSILRYKKENPVKQPKTICLKSYKDYQYLCIEDILFLKADNNTTDFHMSDGRIIGVYKTLKVFESLLPQTFLRIHKSYIINKNSISRIHYGKSMCILNNEHKIPFTKTFIANIDWINKTLSKNTMITLN